MTKLIPTRLEADYKVRALLSGKSYDDVAKDIGISRPTLYARLERKNWRKSELALIKTL